MNKIMKNYKDIMSEGNTAKYFLLGFLLGKVIFVISYFCY